MNIIYIKENELKKFKLISNENYEIYFCNNKLYKIFNKEYLKHQNLEQKLLLLDNIILDDRFNKAQELIYIDNEFRGYTMDFISLITLEECMFKSLQQKISLLKQIKDIIIKAHDNNITLGNIYMRNFTLKGNTVHISNLDDCSIGNYDISYFNRAITRRYLSFQPLDENIDWYLFNVIVISLTANIYPPFMLDCYCMKNTIFDLDPQLKEYYTRFLDFKNPNYQNEDILDILKNKKRFFIF